MEKSNILSEIISHFSYATSPEQNSTSYLRLLLKQGEIRTSYGLNSDESLQIRM